jgi:hypothetical protein
VANKRIPDLALVTTLTGDESIPLSQAGATKRATADLLVLNKGDVPQVRAGAAAATDASGNPTPDTTAFPPANFPLGSLFYATSYPAAVADGQMTFRRVGAAGSEAWAWFRGSFWASNSNGDYVRSADGVQECGFLNSTSTSTDSAAGNIFFKDATPFTFPAAFAVAPKAKAIAVRSTGIVWGVESGVTATGLNVYLAGATNGAAGTLGYYARGKWKA